MGTYSLKHLPSHVKVRFQPVETCVAERRNWRKYTGLIHRFLGSKVGLTHPMLTRSKNDSRYKVITTGIICLSTFLSID